MHMAIVFLGLWVAGRGASALAATSQASVACCLRLPCFMDYFGCEGCLLRPANHRLVSNILSLAPLKNSDSCPLCFLLHFVVKIGKIDAECTEPRKGHFLSDIYQKRN